MSATIYRCLGGHPDEYRIAVAARQAARDASETSIAAYEGALPGEQNIGGRTHLLSELSHGQWIASVLCPHCGSMYGSSGDLRECQALIDRHQFHVAGCGGRGAA